MKTINYTVTLLASRDKDVQKEKVEFMKDYKLELISLWVSGVKNLNIGQVKITQLKTNKSFIEIYFLTPLKVTWENRKYSLMDLETEELGETFNKIK